jgi:hypothetical protein
MSVFPHFSTLLHTRSDPLYHRTDVNVASFKYDSLSWPNNCPVCQFCTRVATESNGIFAKTVGNRQVYVDPVGSYFPIFIDLIYQFSQSITVKF